MFKSGLYLEKLPCIVSIVVSCDYEWTSIVHLDFFYTRGVIDKFENVLNCVKPVSGTYK